jgi:hypothetical protein
MLYSHNYNSVKIGSEKLWWINCIGRHTNLNFYGTIKTKDIGKKENN